MRVVWQGWQCWQIWAGVAVVGAALVLVLPVAIGALLLGVVSLTSTAGVIRGIRRNRPERRLPWLLIAAGAVTWAVADVVFYGLALAGETTFPTVADLGFLAVYPLFAAALYLFIRLGAGREDRLLMVDVIVTVVCVAAVAQVAHTVPVWLEAPSTPAAAVSAAYVLGDVVLLVLLAQVAVGGLARTPAWRLLGLAFVGALVADIFYQAVLLGGGANSLGSADSPVVPLMYAAWIVMHALWAAAANHPSMRALGEERVQTRPGTTVGRVVLLGAALFALPASYALGLGREWGLSQSVMSAAGVVAVPLVFWRVVDIVRRAQAQACDLARISRQDDLTGTENRRALLERVGEVARAGACNRPTTALLVVGVQGLGELSETVGHRPAEEILRLAGERLRVLVPGGHVARIGGHVFGLLACVEGGGVSALTDVVRARLGEPFLVEGMTLSVEPAVGVVASVEPGASATALLHHGELALETAATQPSRVAVYSPALLRLDAAAPSLVGDLAEAVAKGQVLPWYQPQLDLESGRVVGLEALARWEHPRYGLLAPAAFVPAAERTGLVRDLTRVMLDRALADLAEWRRWRPALTVAVNLSVRDLLDPLLPEEVAAALARHRVPAQALELEITETMAMIEPEQALCVLESLASLGVVLSVDDYGVGYGSLAYLQRLPVRRIKIDRTFVAELENNAASRVIIASTVELAAQLGLTVVAEGVERLDDLRWLRSVGCGAAQGFAIARPCAGGSLRAEVEAAERRLVPLLGRVGVNGGAVGAGTVGAAVPERALRVVP